MRRRDACTHVCVCVCVCTRECEHVHVPAHTHTPVRLCCSPCCQAGFGHVTIRQRLLQLWITASLNRHWTGEERGRRKEGERKGGMEEGGGSRVVGTGKDGDARRDARGKWRGRRENRGEKKGAGGGNRMWSGTSHCISLCTLTYSAPSSSKMCHWIAASFQAKLHFLWACHSFLLHPLYAERHTGDESSWYTQLHSVHRVCLIMFLLTEQL